MVLQYLSLDTPHAIFFLGKKDMVPLNRAEAADQMTKVGGFCGLTWGMDFPANTQDIQ